MADPITPEKLREPVNAHEKIKTAKPFRALHAEHGWHPYIYVGDGYKLVAFRRADKAGHIVPSEDGERWWPSFSHPYLCGRAGWHHHALGWHSTKESAAMAFDTVYDLELRVGNLDRLTKDDADGVRAAADEIERLADLLHIAVNPAKEG